MRYGISNPGMNPNHPYYTIEGTSFEVLACAVTLLGEGRYGLRPRGDGRSLPALAGKVEPLALFEKIVGKSFDRIIEQREAVAAALRTVTAEADDADPAVGARARQIADALTPLRPPTPENEDFSQPPLTVMPPVELTPEPTIFGTGNEPPPPPEPEEPFVPGGGAFGGGGAGTEWEAPAPEEPASEPESSDSGGGDSGDSGGGDA